eukprot:10244039-Alexandrium_andersonii.AAC.1
MGHAGLGALRIESASRVGGKIHTRIHWRLQHWQVNLGVRFGMRFGRVLPRSVADTGSRRGLGAIWEMRR